MAITNLKCSRLLLLASILLLVTAAFFVLAQPTTAWAQEDPGNCLDFDGIDDYISVLLDEPETNVTHELWFKTSNPDTGILSIVKTDLGTEGIDRVIYLSGGNIKAYIWNDEHIGSSRLNLADNRWHHVAHVFGGSISGQNLYVDGKLVASGSKAASDFMAQERLNIGFGAFTASNHFDGKIDEVRIWEVTRSGTDIQDNMNQPLTGSETGLAAYYDFDQTGGIILPDLAGTNSGSLTGMNDSDWQKSYALLRPGTLAASNVGTSSFTANWTAPAFGGTPTVYYLDVGTNSYFSGFVSGYENLNVGTVTAYPVSGLEWGTEYFYQVRAYRSGTTGQSQSSEVVPVTTDGCFLDITVDPVGSGTVILNPPGRRYDIGTVVTLTGTSSIGCAFIEWTGSLEGSINPGTLMMDSNKSVNVHFVSPVIIGLSPADDQTNVAFDSNLVITFDMPVSAGSGNITIKRAFDDSIFEIIAAAATTISGSRVTVNPVSELGGIDYYVLIDSNAFHDSASNYYAGISDKQTWNFRAIPFTDISAGLTGVAGGSAAWGDYDNDGDLDILLTGNPTSPDSISKVYRNDSGVFTDIDAGLTGVERGSVAWGDYDNDGDLDILLTGYYDDGPPLYRIYYISKVYRNDSGFFTDIGAGLTGVCYSSVAWGDYDNDGDLDILLTGNPTSPDSISKVYRNDSGSFTDMGAGLTGVVAGPAAWGDYDNDGDLDILLTGADGGSAISKVYRNESPDSNTHPAAPTGLWTSRGTDGFDFGWTAASDNQTPQNGLTYNLRIGTNTNGGQIFPPHSDTATGYRRVPQSGNTGHNLSWLIKIFPQARYYWSVQAIDTAWAGSPYATEATVTVPQLALSNPFQMTGDDLLTWEVQYLDRIENYQVQIDDDPGFGSPEIDDLVDPHLNEVQSSGMEAMAATAFDAGSAYCIALNNFTTYSNLDNGNTYYWRIRPIYTNIANTLFTWEDIPWFTFIGDTFTPVITSCNDAGMEQNWFKPADTVYVKGKGLQANTVYVLWVQSNPVMEGQGLAVINPPENNNNPIDTVFVMTDSSGEFPPTAIWPIPADSPVTSTQFDIVVDYGGGSGYYNASTDGLDSFAADANLTELLVEIKLDLQGGNRPPGGWEVPIDIGFFSPGADVMSDTPIYSFTGTTTAISDSGTRAYFACPNLVLSGTYDITADSTTTLLNVKRSVGIW